MIQREKLFFGSGISQNFENLNKSKIVRKVLKKCFVTIMGCFFSLPLGVKMSKHGPCYDILTPGGREKRVIAFLS